MQKISGLFYLFMIGLVGLPTCGDVVAPNPHEDVPGEQPIYIPGNSYLDAWHFTNKGRITRKVCLYGFLHQIIFEASSLFGLYFLKEKYSEQGSMVNSIPFPFYILIRMLIVLFPSIAGGTILVRRFQDTNLPIIVFQLYSMVILLLSIVYWVMKDLRVLCIQSGFKLAFMFIMLFIPGVRGPNKYGLDPLMGENKG